MYGWADLQYGFHVSFRLEIGGRELVIDPLHVSFRIEREPGGAEERGWTERIFFPAFRLEGEPTLYRVEAQLPAPFQSDRDVLVMCGLDRKEEVVFSLLVMHRWACFQRQSLASGHLGDPLRFCSRKRNDAVVTTLWLHRMGSKVGKAARLFGGVSCHTLGTLDSLLHGLEKECLRFRSRMASLVHDSRFPAVLAGHHCSLPLYFLCCLQHQLDKASFGFTAGTAATSRASGRRGAASPWVSDWCKAWTLAKTACGNGGQHADDFQREWWCTVDLLVGNPSSVWKKDTCLGNESPFPALSGTRHTGPLDRMARRLALCQFLQTTLNSERKGAAACPVMSPVFDFLNGHRERAAMLRKLKDCRVCVAVARRPDGEEGDELLLLHGLCSADVLSATGPSMTPLEGATFHRDCLLGPEPGKPCTMELLAVLWRGGDRVTTATFPPCSARLHHLHSNVYATRMQGEVSASGWYVKEGEALDGEVTAAVALESCKLLRPCLSDAFIGSPWPEDSRRMWVTWQKGWMHRSTCRRRRGNDRLAFATPGGFWLPLAR